MASFHSSRLFLIQAGKVELLLQAFARRYRTVRPNEFESEDCPFLLAFSIVLLNTELQAVCLSFEM